MTPEQYKELTKHEVEFLKGEGCGTINEHGAWAYQSKDGNHLIALDFYLAHYKSWLIENNIVKEV